MFRFTLFLLFITFPLLLLDPPAHAARTVTNVGTEIGRYAPPLELEDLTGIKVSLKSLKGTVVLLNFWSSVCPSCKAQIPSMSRLSDLLKEKGFRVVTVAIDATDQAVREYSAKNGVSCTVLLDTGKAVFSDRYDSPDLPATYLIDRDGIIVEKFNGLQVWDAPEMKNRILMLLKRNN